MQAQGTEIIVTGYSNHNTTTELVGDWAFRVGGERQLWYWLLLYLIVSHAKSSFAVCDTWLLPVANKKLHLACCLLAKLELKWIHPKGNQFSHVWWRAMVFLMQNTTADSIYTIWSLSAWAFQRAMGATWMRLLRLWMPLGNKILAVSETTQTLMLS